MKLINFVQKLRIKKGLTQEELAKHVGVTRQTIIAVEKGDYTPSVILAIKISKFFGVKLENIFKIK